MNGHTEQAADEDGHRVDLTIFFRKLERKNKCLILNMHRDT